MSLFERIADLSEAKALAAPSMQKGRYRSALKSERVAKDAVDAALKAVSAFSDVASGSMHSGGSDASGAAVGAGWSKDVADDVLKPLAAAKTALAHAATGFKKYARKGG